MYNTVVSENINLAVQHLLQDELVAIPTETVYGLAANACSPAAVEKVFAVKNRPHSNPLIVHVPGIDAIRPFVKDIPPAALRLLKAFAPGPLTVLLPSNGRLPALVNNGQPLLAFRIPAHLLTLQLLRKIPFPLVAPSANVFTGISPTTPQHVLKNFQGTIPFVLDGGACRVGVESTVIGFTNGDAPVLYRPGALTQAELETVAGVPVVRHQSAATPSPGMLLHHYAPTTPLLLLPSVQPLPPGLDPATTGVLCFRQPNSQLPLRQQFVLSEKGSLEEAASNLYRGLHYLDDLKLSVLVAERLPPTGLGLTLNDRLEKAAHAHPTIEHYQTKSSICQARLSDVTGK